MNDSPEAIVVITTVEDQKDGEALGQMLVERQLAACVQVLPAMTSVYHWQEHIEYATESLLLIKTIRALYIPLEAAIKEHHRYQTPEIIALPILTGSSDYLTWLTSVVKRQA